MATALLALFLAAPAHADKQAALREYDAGRAAYDLGRFEQAIRHFEAAYEAEPAPAFLFNIAQSHRQLGRCDKALFFYRRYLRLDPDTKIRAEVEGRISELEASCEAPEPAQPPPPAEPPPPASAPPPTAAPPPIAAPPPAEPPPATVLALSLEAGVGFADIGDLDVPVQPSFRLGVAYPLELGPVGLRLGALGTLLPVPYEGGTALLSQALAQAEVVLPVASWLRLRSELGVGVAFFSGLDEGNPFTVSGARASGALSMFAIRVGAGLEVPVSDAWQARLTAASFSYSPPKAGLAESIERLLRFELTAGFGLEF